MARYIVSGMGRSAGAIGIFYAIAVEVEADSEADAVLESYGKRDWLFTPKAREVTEGPMPCECGDTIDVQWRDSEPEGCRVYCCRACFSSGKVR